MAKAQANRDVSSEGIVDGINYDCRQLWAGVMQQAIDDLGDENERVRNEARVWFHSDLKDISSFLWICDLLELDPERVILELKIQQPFLSEPEPPTTEGGRLKAWRLERDMLLLELARLIPCSKGYLSSIESGFFPMGRYITRRLQEIGFECGSTAH